MILGILGDGQLAMMLSMAARKLNIETLCFGVNNSPASFQSKIYTGNIKNIDDIKEFINKVDIITFETENIPLESLEYLSIDKVLPNVNAIKIFQNRLSEKDFLANLDITIAAYTEITSQDELEEYSVEYSQSILKIAQFGYDGKGQCRINSTGDCTQAWNNTKNNKIILEKLIPFDYEISIITAVDQNKNIKHYPLIKNQHQDGILRISEAPYYNNNLTKQAQLISEKLISELNYIGVICIECFVVNDQLIVNEVAPRVHNSGHWSIEGAKTSQFENHVRAVCGLSLGDTSSIGYSKMINLIGEIPINLQSNPSNGIFIYDYHKQARPNRKLGHINLNSDDPNKLKY